MEAYPRTNGILESIPRRRCAGYGARRGVVVDDQAAASLSRRAAVRGADARQPVRIPEGVRTRPRVAGGAICRPAVRGVIACYRRRRLRQNTAAFRGIVIAGLDPAIPFGRGTAVPHYRDRRVEPGDDGGESSSSAHTLEIRPVRTRNVGVRSGCHWRFSAQTTSLHGARLGR